MVPVKKEAKALCCVVWRKVLIVGHYAEHSGLVVYAGLEYIGVAKVINGALLFLVITGVASVAYDFVMKGKE